MSVLPKSVIASINNEYMLRNLSKSGNYFSYYRARRAGSMLDIDVVIVQRDTLNIKNKGTHFDEIKQVTLGNDSHLLISVGDFYLASDKVDEYEFKRIIENLKSSDELAKSKIIDATLLPTDFSESKPFDQHNLNSKISVTEPKKKTNKKIWLLAGIIVLIILFFVFIPFPKNTFPPKSVEKMPDSKATIQPSDVSKSDTIVPKKEDFYEEGKQYYNSGKFDKAFISYLKSAEMEDANGMIATAYCYESAKGTEKSNNKAAEWYFKAAQQGHTEAFKYLTGLADKSDKPDIRLISMISESYVKGYGVTPNLNEAFIWALKGFNQGDNVGSLSKIINFATENKLIDAQIFLADYYEKIGAKKDAEKWLSEVFSLRRKDFSESLERLRFEICLDYYNAGKFKDGTEWCQKALSVRDVKIEGIKNSQLIFFYALSCIRGEGCQKDVFKAVTLLEKALADGKTDAKSPLAETYLEAGNIRYSENKIKEAIPFFEKSAKLGNSNALSSLGMCYYNLKDYHNAEEWLAKTPENAANKVSYQECLFQLGSEYERANDYQPAFKYYQKSFDTGNMNAGEKLALMYWRGIGCKKNIGEAFRITGKVSESRKNACSDMSAIKFDFAKELYENKKYTEAFKHFSELYELKYSSDGEVEYYLGLSLLAGNGADKNLTESDKYFKESIQYLKKIAGSGDKNAIMQLAKVNMGLNDYIESEKWYRKAFDLNIPDAEAMLVKCWRDGGSYYISNNLNMEQGIKFLKSASEKGDIDSILALSLHYQNKKNSEAAKIILQKGVDKNSTECMFRLADILEDEDSFFSNTKQEAFRLYTKAAERGHLTAMNNLAFFYNNGIETEKDQELALFWFKKAADAGLTFSFYNIGMIYYNKEEFENAWKYFIVAAEKGEVKARIRLAEMIVDRKIKKDDVKISITLEYLNELSKKGNTEAIYLLVQYRLKGYSKLNLE
jgi:TPR repeat protein